MENNNSSVEPTDRPQPLGDCDDVVLPFRVELINVIGRLVRLGPALDTIISQHAYPEPVSRRLAEAVTLAALLGPAIKDEGRLILQVQTDGPVNLLIADYQTPGQLRAYAGFDEAKVTALITEKEMAGQTVTSADLLGSGHLVMTIDQGSERQRYQGVVPVERGDLSAAANAYFEQSEQLPTFIRIAVAKHAIPDGSRAWTWRSGGLLVQHLATKGGKTLGAKTEPSSSWDENETDGWTRVNLLAKTVKDHELLDPLLLPERLLFRLFHEERVRVYPVKSLRAQCHCSRDRIKHMLKSFSPEEIKDMIKDGKIEVTCQFCNRLYAFSPDEFAAK